MEKLCEYPESAEKEEECGKGLQDNNEVGINGALLHDSSISQNI